MRAIAIVVDGIARIWRGLRLDAAAAKGFGNAPGDVWRSYAAAAVGLPLFAAMLRTSVAALPSRPSTHFFLVMLLFYVIEWTAWPNLMVTLARRMNRETFLCRYLVAYNWLALAQMAVMMPYQMLALSPAMPWQTMAAIGTAATVAFGVYEWFIARHALELSGKSAFGVVLMNLLLGLFLLQIKARMIL